MGQSESPLIVRPYVPDMTRSELLALMTCGMATLSGGMIAVYVQKGADAVALLAGGMMSAPCALYLAKLLLPEYETPRTAAGAKAVHTRKYSNAIEAIADGASAGVMLLIKMVAMVIAFLSIIALVDYLLHCDQPRPFAPRDLRTHLRTGGVPPRTGWRRCSAGRRAVGHQAGGQRVHRLHGYDQSQAHPS